MTTRKVIALIIVALPALTVVTALVHSFGWLATMFGLIFFITTLAALIWAIETLSDF